MWELFTGLGQPCAGILIVKVSCKWLSHLHRNEKHPPHVRGIIAWGLCMVVLFKWKKKTLYIKRKDNGQPTPSKKWKKYVRPCVACCAITCQNNNNNNKIYEQEKKN